MCQVGVWSQHIAAKSVLPILLEHILSPYGLLRTLKESQGSPLQTVEVPSLMFPLREGNWGGELRLGLKFMHLLIVLVPTA